MLRHDQTKSKRIRHPREESSYRNMMSRCYNPKATGYSFYGGRGIQVCEQWRGTFDVFLQDMGERPEGMSLDRRDVHGDYTPNNCRWATAKEQGNNTSSHYWLEYGGEKLNLSQWAERLGIIPNTIYYRLARGWSAAEALGFVERTPPWLGKLTPEQVQYTLNQVASGRTQTEVGKELGIHSSQISRICNGKTKNKSKEEK